MKESYYYRRGAVIGLLLVFIVAYGIMGEALGDMFTSIRLIIPMLTAYVCCYWLAYLTDVKYKKPTNFCNTLGLGVGVFTFSVLVGVTMNFLCNGLVRSFSGSFMREIASWFFGPAYFLLVIGVPCAIVISIFYYLGNKAFRCLREKTI